MIQAETLELLEWSRLCQHLSTFAATKLGKTAASHLRIPTAQAESETLLAQTQEAYQLENRLAGGLGFDGIQDIGESLDRAELQGILSGNELLDIATTLAGARQLRRIIDSHPDLETLNALLSDLRTYPELEQEIHRCIDDRGRVTDRANPKLEGIRSQIRTLRDRIHEQLQKILQRQSNAIQESLITQRGERFVIPVKSSHKDLIPGIVHDTSTSGVTLYVEPQVIVNNGNQLRQLLRQEQREEEELRRQLTEQVAEVKPDLERLLLIATLIDLATAKARYSLWLEANPPRFIPFTPSSAEPIVLRQLRHPLLVWQQQHEQGNAVVPVDLVIRPQLRVVAITGPNTGGKTVTLKTLGLAMLMAKVGLFIPAREPVELPWFEQILADIGDEQSLQQSLSTFSGHIRRISRILAALEQPEQNSDGSLPSSPSNFPASALILLDEVGAGTDPSEGSALAISLLQYLADHAALTVATTHFGELKALKYQDNRFENASVEFDDRSLSPTYRLLWGIPGRSNALAIAQRLGLQPEIVQQAQQQQGISASQEVNQVIAGLEAQRRQQEEKAQTAAQLVQQAERLHQEVSRKADLLKQRERELQQQQELAIQQALTQAKSEIAQVIRRLQQGNPTAQAAQQATDALNQIATQKLPSRQPPAKPKPGFRPQIGDRVKIPRLGQTAEVITNPDADNELTVRFGLMKMTVSLTDVESLQGEKAELPPKPAPPPPPPPPAAAAPTIRTSQNTIDIRGNRVADAERVLERKMAETEAGALWVIHGHGTGKLRHGIQDFLKRHPQVERFEAAEQSDGGTGVTVAYLRGR
ncbi:MAG: endonuclease MutS2 [Pegethrix bostrychoides GSE-TBD4-15B]|uniref:Endonuclease MutS2 n=1 Tax=Pegethrix bostrychoides GSE-TBD4-15B TaxID=2839662 RepID=A0A951PBA4_9CYAN|nr:endonuclease MutS2 [Pegethrix bostrychoides GSE-TBD4-15B]